MKFTISQEEFLRALGAVSGVVPSRTTLPILSDVLIETTEDRITLSATDLDLSVMVRAKASVKSAGAVTLPARRLSELIRELPPSPVHVESVGEKVAVECEKTKFRFFGHPKADFPTFPVLSFEKALEIPRGLFERLVHHTSYAASTEDTRPILNGVLWEVQEAQMRMVATNGHRLATFTAQRPDSGAAVSSVILSPKALTYAARVFEGEETLQVAFGENQAGIQAGGGTLYTRLIEGPYPNYQQVIPRDNDDGDARLRQGGIGHGTRPHDPLAGREAPELAGLIAGPVDAPPSKAGSRGDNITLWPATFGATYFPTGIPRPSRPADRRSPRDCACFHRAPSPTTITGFSLLLLKD